MADDTPLARLEAAVQAFVNETAGHPRIVTGAVAVFESVRLDDDGDTGHRLDYASMAPSIALTVGLLEVGRDRILTDVKSYRARDDDEDE